MCTLHLIHLLVMHIAPHPYIHRTLFIIVSYLIHLSVDLTSFSSTPCFIHECIIPHPYIYYACHPCVNRTQCPYLYIAVLRGNLGETSERRGGAHNYGLFRAHRYHLELNWTRWNHAQATVQQTKVLLRLRLRLCHNTLTPARTRRPHGNVVMRCIVMWGVSLAMTSSLHNSIHPPEMEINLPETVFGCIPMWWVYIYIYI